MNKISLKHILVTASLLGALFYFVIVINQLITIDKCLDCGGRWNYEAKESEKNSNSKQKQTTD
jgi:hypothetical protein